MAGKAFQYSTLNRDQVEAARHQIVTRGNVVLVEFEPLRPGNKKYFVVKPPGERPTAFDQVFPALRLAEAIALSLKLHGVTP
jgi:hypothetical protein